MPRGIVIGHPTPTYEYYKKDVPHKTNIFKIVIQKKGKFEHLTIEKPMSEESFTFRYGSNVYDVKPEYVFPKDANIFTKLKRKIKRIHIPYIKSGSADVNYEYFLLYQEGNPEAIVYHGKEKISGTLLHSVLYSKASQNMLRSLREGGFKFPQLNLRMIIILGTVVVIAIFSLQKFGFIPEIIPL